MHCDDAGCFAWQWRGQLASFVGIAAAVRRGDRDLVPGVTRNVDDGLCETRPMRFIWTTAVVVFVAEKKLPCGLRWRRHSHV
jgi:hypothetical protein